MATSKKVLKFLAIKHKQCFSFNYLVSQNAGKRARGVENLKPAKRTVLAEKTKKLLANADLESWYVQNAEFRHASVELIFDYDFIF